MISYFDYVEDTSLMLSKSRVKEYDEIIIFLEKKEVSNNYVKAVTKYKNTNDKVFIYYVLYWFLTINEQQLDLTLDDKMYLIINCIDELSDITYYDEIKKLFEIN